MSTVYKTNLNIEGENARLIVKDERAADKGFSATLQVRGALRSTKGRIAAEGINPLRAMQHLMSDPAALHWRNEIEAEMENVLLAA